MDMPLFDMINLVEQCYEGWSIKKILKSGSFWDKALLIVIMLLTIFSCLFLFYTEVYITNFVLQLFSLILFIFIYATLLIMTTRFQRRENFLFHKGMSLEQEQLSSFVFNLSKQSIFSNDYERIINFYKNKLDRDAATRTNEIGIYLSVVLIPSLITVLGAGDEERTLLFIIIVAFGVFVIPGILLSISVFINRRKYLYSGIIYSIELLLQINDYNLDIEKRKKLK